LYECLFSLRKEAFFYFTAAILPAEIIFVFMLSRVYCAFCRGMDVLTVTVEVDVCDGISFFMVGLPDVAVKESQQRIGTALKRYGYRIPGKKIVINLAPADEKKGGSAFDAAIAVGILAASGQIKAADLSKYMILGELALDGSLRPIHGALPIVIHALEKGFSACILPAESAAEGSEIEGIDVYGANDLGEILDILMYPDGCSRLKAGPRLSERTGNSSVSCPGAEENETAGSGVSEYDFANVRGQAFARKGLEIAAAGGHNVIMVGSPGSGKTFMAKCLPSILPPMNRIESLETSKIYSLAGMFPPGGGLMKKRPFRAPHSSITVPALVGGGLSGAPGEVSLANNGVLFLDEFAEFGRPVLEVLRQPLEDRIVQVCRVRTRYVYPASFMLVAAMNPCPCGKLDDDSGACTCTSSEIRRYLGKISGPLMDRIDIHLRVRPVPAEDIVGNVTDCRKCGPFAAVPESSASIASRVMAARKIQAERYVNEKFFINAMIPSSMLDEYCRTGDRERSYLKKIIDRLHISARGYARILKISRTIADLDGDDFISLKHISQAVRFRAPQTN
jgi:magnesium chelatase family protein